MVASKQRSRVRNGRSIFGKKPRKSFGKRLGLEALEDRRLLAAAIVGVTLDPALVPKFVTPLPQALDPSFVYKPNGTTSVTLENGKTATVPLYTVGAYQIEQSLGLGTYGDLGIIPPAGKTDTDQVMTTVYGYGADAASATYPGRSFEVQRGKAIAVNWVDGLTSDTHILPVDPTVLDPMAQGDPSYEVDPITNQVTFPSGIPLSPHLHGGHTQAAYDGTPLQWFTTDPTVLGTDYAGTQQFVNYVYDNTQQSATLWYHDHSMGITRLNVDAGLAGFYIVHDANEQDLVARHFLPAKPYDIPMAIQDRLFTTDGQLYYPQDVEPGTTATYPSAHAEFFGDTIMVNGQAWPELNVEPRMYRFRLLNGSDSRFYNLSLDNGLTMYQVGTDDGLLQRPVKSGQLLIAPGERADIVIDFSKMKGKTITLQNIFGSNGQPTPAPFPSGDPGNAYPTVAQIMQFVVNVPHSRVPDVVRLATRNLAPAYSPRAATNQRDMALFETTDQFGRLIQELGTPQDGLKSFMDSVDPADTVQLIRNKNGTQSVVEKWRVFNTTMDVHPIHLHQVTFQVVSRQKFAATTTDPVTLAFDYMTYGKAVGPNVNEVGAWKDTVQMAPGEVTTIVVKFDLPGKYVWHCHILSHEEHDMMHYLTVLPAASKGALASASVLAAPSGSATIAGVSTTATSTLPAAVLASAVNRLEATVASPAAPIDQSLLAPSVSLPAGALPAGPKLQASQRAVDELLAQFGQTTAANPLRDAAIQ